MDALLWELLAEGLPDDRVEVLIKFPEPGKLPAKHIEVVARIGNIVSCRIRRGDIEAIRGYDEVLSMKAQKTLFPDQPFNEDSGIVNNGYQQQRGIQRRPETPYTGLGVNMGFADIGFDFTHPNFLNEDGSSRFVAIWDQGTEYDGHNIYGYGTIHYQKDINHALASEFPFQELRYFPCRSDIFHQGMHGIHVVDIAAGNGAVGDSGVAPESRLIAVHLATEKFKDLMDLGTSVRLFDAIHFLDTIAGAEPLVINLSFGSHGDAHLGLSLIEQAIDQLVTSKEGRAVVQSCGNYFAGRTHLEGCLSTGSYASLNWLISGKDKTRNEIEIWYEPPDNIELSLRAPDGTFLLQETGTGRASIKSGKGEEIGRYYHREKEPATQLNQIVIFLDENAAFGRWEIILSGRQIKNGRYHAWIERDFGSSSWQSRFSVQQAVSTTTTNSICNGYYNICVGAYDGWSSGQKIGFFSSVGPTWDGRIKPDICAEGVGILAAKSASPYENRSGGELTYKTGTSMASPVVAGAIALLYEASGKPLSIHEVRDKLWEACIPPKNDNEEERFRYGRGILDIEKLLSDNNGAWLFKQNINGKAMDDFNKDTFPVESLLESFQRQFPSSAIDQLCLFFDSLPSEKSIRNNNNVQQGDLLIRRQYGHHNRIWYGVVECVEGNEAQVFCGKTFKKIILSKDNRCFDPELKRIKPGDLRIFTERADNPDPDFNFGNKELNEKGLHYKIGQIGEETPEKGPSGKAAAAIEVDLAEFKTKKDTAYGKWTFTTTLKSAATVSESIGLPVGGKVAVTSKFQDGKRVMGAKKEFTYSELKNVFKNLQIENFTLKLGGAWSGLEISGYGVASFDFVTGLAKIPVTLKIYIFKIREGESPKLGEIQGYFDSPTFEIKISGLKTKVFLRNSISWKLDKGKAAKEIIGKIAKEKLEQEAKKQGVKFLGRKAGENILKRLGPVVAAFGVGWDLGTLLNKFTIADDVAADIHQEILGDLNIRFQKAGTLEKMVLITKNSPKIIASLLASGFVGVTAGVADIVLFKIFGLDKLPDFDEALKSFMEIMDVIPNVGGAFVDLLAGEMIKIGIKLNPEYSIIKDPEVREITKALYTRIEPMYKMPNALDRLIGLRLYDFDVDYGKLVDLIVQRQLNGVNILDVRGQKQEILTNLLDLHLADFLRFLEKNGLIVYKIKFGEELGMEPIDQKLVNALFL